MKLTFPLLPPHEKCIKQRERTLFEVWHLGHVAERVPPTKFHFHLRLATQHPTQRGCHRMHTYFMPFSMSFIVAVGDVSEVVTFITNVLFVPTGIMAIAQK